MRVTPYTTDAGGGRRAALSSGSAERSGETSLGIMIALSATAVGIMALYNHAFDLMHEGKSIRSVVKY